MARKLGFAIPKVKSVVKIGGKGRNFITGKTRFKLLTASANGRLIGANSRLNDIGRRVVQIEHK